MLILAIDTSARHFSLALLNDEKLVARFDSRAHQNEGDFQGEGKPVVRKNRTATSENIRSPGVSVTLFPALKDLMKTSGTKWNDIELVATSTGPGLFTGLRIGVVASKTLAFVHQIPVIGVNTLEVIAAQAALAMNEHEVLIKPVLNAQRQQLFAGSFRVKEAWSATEFEPNLILNHEQWLDSLNENEVVCGPGLKPLLSQLKGETTTAHEKVRIAPKMTWDCSAEGVARVARKHFLAGRRDDLWTLEPFYFRPSAAEEVLVARQKSESKN